MSFYTKFFLSYSKIKAKKTLSLECEWIYPDPTTCSFNAICTGTVAGNHYKKD